MVNLCHPSAHFCSGGFTHLLCVHAAWLKVYARLIQLKGASLWKNLWKMWRRQGLRSSAHCSMPHLTRFCALKSRGGILALRKMYRTIGRWLKSYAANGFAGLKPSKTYRRRYQLCRKLCRDFRGGHHASPGMSFPQCAGHHPNP